LGPDLREDRGACLLVAIDQQDIAVGDLLTSSATHGPRYESGRSAPGIRCSHRQGPCPPSVRTSVDPDPGGFAVGGAARWLPAFALRRGRARACSAARIFEQQRAIEAAPAAAAPAP